MIEVGAAVRVYSDLNEQIDFVIFVGKDEDIEEPKRIIETAWDEWWESDEDGQIPIGDYISDRLAEAGVDHDIFWKEDGLYEND